MKFLEISFLNENLRKHRGFVAQTKKIGQLTTMSSIYPTIR